MITAKNALEIFAVNVRQDFTYMIIIHACPHVILMLDFILLLRMEYGFAKVFLFI